ncbi:hypothetical protein AAHA92_30472 [Salvia divinorum]|uniref:Zinc finger PHD-type domain-containing protein n=1 Tax=Salvia divinorum TaxID=28513 RepID=A0ABD1FQZ9_SALDI
MEESFLHMLHEHPLSRIPDSAQKTDYDRLCLGCSRYFLPGDATYGCSSNGCRFQWLLHKECMEMPREIMHPLHPSHPLTLHFLENISESIKCAVCNVWGVYRLHYRCSAGCDGLILHLACAGARNEKHPPMEHPSHPEHPLRFSRKTRWCPFPCDACGATEKGDSYICTLCDYSIHESCALLPESKDFPHHHHPLSLSFYVPHVYIRYDFYCAICNLTLPLRCWVYHCHLCSYVVHLNCATSTVDNENENANAIGDEKEVTTVFPIAVDDMYEEIIRPFVKRQKGQILIPHHHLDHDHDDNHNISGKYSFSNHPHLLTFITFPSSSSSSSSHHHYKKDKEDEDDFPRLELTCDGCTLPICVKKQTDGDGYESGYMSCDECKYFLHLSCFNLPPHIPSLPLHHREDHNLLMLQNSAKLMGWIKCKICYAYTNGLYYACTYKYCSFVTDIKCASLPNTMKHAAHPRHNYLNLVTGNYGYNYCGNCDDLITPLQGQYRCNSCRFSVCRKCVMLPATNKHRLEKHLMWLTYDSYVNRPGEFYCSSCENRMSPRSWMYHCRDCDQSFHPECFPATSGYFRNIKYGAEQYVISSIHDHPLRFQIISNKKRCDLCHDDRYNEPGFQCASCFFVACLFCGVKHMDGATPV